MHTFIILLKNTRPLQMIYHIGLMLIGSGLALIFVPHTRALSLYDLFLLTLAIILAWVSTVYFNDAADMSIDAISNPHRPLPRRLISRHHSMMIGWGLLVTSGLLSLLLSGEIFITLMIYHILSWMYSMPPLRWKRIPLVATFLAACASLAIIFCGFLLFADIKDFTFFPKNIALLLLIGYTLCLPLKDFRDIDGDRADGIKTLPVLFGTRRARYILAGNLFISFMLTVLLVQKNLFFPAVVFGALSALILALRRNDHFIVPIRWLLPIIFSLTFLYGVIVVWILFIR